MSRELGNRIRELRGEAPLTEFGKKVGLSFRTIYKVEQGEKIKLSTIQKIAKGLRLPDAERLALIHSWIASQLGEDYSKFYIEPKEPSALKEEATNPVLKITALARKLSLTDQQQVAMALERPEVLTGIRDLNRLYSNFTPSPSQAKKSASKKAA